MILIKNIFNIGEMVYINPENYFREYLIIFISDLIKYFVVIETLINVNVNIIIINK